MTQTYVQSCDKSNTFIIIAIKNTARVGSNKLKHTIFERTKQNFLNSEV